MIPEFAAILGLLAAFVLPPAALPIPAADAVNAAPAAWIDAPEIDARAWLLGDAASGKILAGENPDLPHPPASLVKLGVALLVLERGDLDASIEIPRGAATVEGFRIGLRTGETRTRRELLRLALVRSANDAAAALALDVPDFRDELTTRLTELGITGTRVRHLAGMDEAGARITARGAFHLARRLESFDEFQEIVRMDRVDFCEETCQSWSSTNLALGETFGAWTVTGGKTGTTEGAGENLVLVFERDDGARRILVLLGATDRWAAAREIGLGLGGEG